MSRVLSMLAVLWLCAVGVGQAAPVSRVSLPDAESWDESLYAAISAGGRYASFYTEASNLVPGDTNSQGDVFVHDRLSGDTARVSVASDGTQGDDRCALAPSPLSGDGRYVAFCSYATNLVAGDTNGVPDIFVHDRNTGATTRVSVATGGTQGNNVSSKPAISADGRYVAFESDATNLVAGDTNGYRDVFLHDRTTGETVRVSLSSTGAEGNGSSQNAALSPDGEIVAFDSGANNLVPGDTNARRDVFRREWRYGYTSRESTTHDMDAQANGDSSSPSLGFDGSSWIVAFASDATNLAASDTNGVTDIYVKHPYSLCLRASVASDGTEGNGASDGPVLSADGRYVTFYSHATNLVTFDTNGLPDIFVRDLLTNQTERVNLRSDGSQSYGDCGYPDMSANGRCVVFRSSDYLVMRDRNGVSDIFLRDRDTDQTERVSLPGQGMQGDGYSGYPALSAEGRYVAFTSGATNLVEGDTNGREDVFVRDRDTGRTTRVSVTGSVGGQANGISGSPQLSADGERAAYVSWATNLVTGDTNSASDVFLTEAHSLYPYMLCARVSVASDGTQANGWSDSPEISGDGRYVAFRSSATNLVAGDTNGVSDIFVHDYGTGQTTRVSTAQDGTQANGHSYEPYLAAVGADLYVAFASEAGNLGPADTNGVSDVYVRYPYLGYTAVSLASVASDGTQGDSSSNAPALSADGRYVVFQSYATNLVPGDTNDLCDVFVHDLVTGETTRVSVASDGTQGNGLEGCYDPAISADGRYVLFSSDATNLVPGDTNSSVDTFLHDRLTGQTTRVSVAGDGSQADGDCYSAVLSADSRYISFGSWATNLAPGDTNALFDVFVCHLPAPRFTDIATDNWAYWYIEACVNAGIVGGYGSNYRPTLTLTRDAMTVFLSRAMAGGEAFVPAGPLLPTFTDVATDHWAYKYIEYAVDCGVTGGYADGTFRPQLLVDRGAMAVFVARAMCGGEACVPAPPATAYFTDIPTSHWAFRYVEYIRGEGVVGGYGDGTYRPLQTVTRDAMAVYIQRAFCLPM